MKRVRLHWTNNTQWNHTDFFIAPTHLSCDKIIDGKIIATISRLGVPIGYVKDRRMSTQASSTSTTAAKANIDRLGVERALRASKSRSQGQIPTPCAMATTI